MTENEKEQRTIAMAALAGVRFEEMPWFSYGATDMRARWKVTMPNGGTFIARTLIGGAEDAMRVIDPEYKAW